MKRQAKRSGAETVGQNPSEKDSSRAKNEPPRGKNSQIYQYHDRIISYSAVFIAVCSLAVSVWQGHLVAVQNRMSVRPVLMMSEHIDSNDSPWRIEWGNVGSNVAFIEAAFVYVDGKRVCPLGKDWWSHVKRASGYSEPMPVSYEWLTPGQAVPGSTPKQADILSNRNDKTYPLARKQSSAAYYRLIKERIGFHVEYSSMYGDRWRLKYTQGTAITDTKPAGGPTFDD